VSDGLFSGPDATVIINHYKNPQSRTTKPENQRPRCLLLLSVLCLLKAFSPRRRKERKGRQEIRNCLVLLSVLSVFAVKMLGFGVFQGRLITYEGMSLTVAHASGSERYYKTAAHYKIVFFKLEDNIKRYLFYQACLRLPTYETS